MKFGLHYSEKFLDQLAEKEFRDAYVADQVRSRIALLIRTLREQRGLSQAELGTLLGKPQSVVSRLENPDYGKESLQSLLDFAAAFDLPLLVDIPEWEDWLNRVGKLSRDELKRTSFDSQKFKEQARANLEAVRDKKIEFLGERRPVTSSRMSVAIVGDPSRLVSTMVAA